MPVIEVIGYFSIPNLGSQDVRSGVFCFEFSFAVCLYQSLGEAAAGIGYKVNAVIPCCLASIYGTAKALVPVLPKDQTTKLIIRQAVDQLNPALSFTK